MVLDSSAIIAMVMKEAGFERLVAKSEEATLLAVGAPTLLETMMVLTSRLGYESRSIVEGFLQHNDVQVIAFTPDHFDAALAAFLRFGRRRHPAGLNFGDCMAYAIASVSGLPLLYTGGDFAQTDIMAA